MRKNITSLDELAPYVAVGRVVKYSMNNGKTWQYAKITDAELCKYRISGLASPGYGAVNEVMSNGISVARALTHHDFERGMIVRLASSSKARGKKWSYE